VEQWSAGDERPYYLKRERSSRAWPLWIAAIALTAGGIAYCYQHLLEPQAPPSDAAVAASSPAAPAPAAEPATRYRLAEAPPEAAASLPSLERSDSMLRDSLAGLMGRRAFEDFVLPDRLVRRIVATVDNLPRRTAPRRMIPLNPVPGGFVTAGAREGEASMDPANFDRYAPYVRVLEAVDVRALVKLYVAAYPLFQRAYEELGYPGEYFNDRLLDAIDDLLAAPELAAPAALVRPKVLYEFADPDLETRSAGQKILIRMGTQNAQKVKAKAQEFRRALLAEGQRKP
jgi:hypothetical protein